MKRSMKRWPFWASITALAAALFLLLPSRSSALDLKWRPSGTPGMQYATVVVPGNIAGKVVKVDLTNTNLEIGCTLANDTIFGLNTISEQAAAIPPEIGVGVAGLTGDFFKRENESFPGDPRGLMIWRGEWVSSPVDNDCLWFDENGKPQGGRVTSKLAVQWPDGSSTPLALDEERLPGRAVLYTPTLGGATRTRGGRELILETDGKGPWLPLQIGNVYAGKVREVKETGNSRIPKGCMIVSLDPSVAARVPKVEAGAILKIVAQTTPSLAKARYALGGGPLLVSEGKGLAPHVYKADERHPRTAFGWNSTNAFLLVIDGRQAHSRGASLTEMGTILADMGCTTAINMDGGGSAELMMEGKVLNSPSDGYERVTANALVVIRKPKARPPQ